MNRTHLGYPLRVRLGALQSAELLVVFPILGLILLMMLQMGSYFMQQHRLQSAVDAACRAAAVQSSDDSHRYDLATTHFNTLLEKVAWAQDCELNIELGANSGDFIVVSAEVPTRKVLPDLLGMIGLGISEEQRMRASAVMPRI